MAADLEAAGSGAEVAPVAQRPLGHAEVAARFLEGEHVVAGVLAGSWGVGFCGHGGLLVAGFPASFVAGRDGRVSVVERYASYGARWGHQFAPLLAPPLLGTGAPSRWRFRRSGGARPKVQEVIECSSLVVVANDLYVWISMGRQVPRNRGNLRGIPARGPVFSQVNRYP